MSKSCIKLDWYYTKKRTFEINMQHPKYILPIIVIAQFCCTSLWFAGNGVMAELQQLFKLPVSALGHLTSAIQFGFICGTLIYALLSIADRFSPSRVFLGSALLGAFFNLGIIYTGNTFVSLLILRFFTGFFLAGIYPVGMKIAADYYQAGLGKSLGFLVGALVLGTAFPHLLKSVGTVLNWQSVIFITSALALLGACMVGFFVPDGPHRKASQGIDIRLAFRVFRQGDFRAAALGYFGHMWELYTFWTFVPSILMAYSLAHPSSSLNEALWSFCIIAIGGIGCVLGGYLSISYDAKRMAGLFLGCSLLCCLASPLLFWVESKTLLLVYLLFWGMVVVADSPLFSTLVAQNAAPETKGTALTIVNNIGFSLTIISIQTLLLLQALIPASFLYMFLAIGPIIGLLALRSPNND